MNERIGLDCAQRLSGMLCGVHLFDPSARWRMVSWTRAGARTASGAAPAGPLARPCAHGSRHTTAVAPRSWLPCPAASASQSVCGWHGWLCSMILGSGCKNHSAPVPRTVQVLAWTAEHCLWRVLFDRPHVHGTVASPRVESPMALRAALANCHDLVLRRIAAWGVASVCARPMVALLPRVRVAATLAHRPACLPSGETPERAARAPRPRTIASSHCGTLLLSPCGHEGSSGTTSANCTAGTSAHSQRATTTGLWWPAWMTSAP
mmetsp:Transcript_56615/g.132002  ORF Transcript_56615/g.132002 Transcript_56615/m.132002 type:complete len:264 (+) Transcript_56615:214-1005(+)